MAKQLLESGNHQKTHEVLQIKKTVKAAEKRLGELERFVMSLYEEYVSERLNGDNYSMMLAKYQNEQTELQQKVSALNEVLTRSDETGKNIDEFLSLIVRYADITALTPEVVGQLISKIAVHKAVTVDGIRTQQLDIHWRFIGMTNWGL
jgi:hypothetical protein